MGAGQSTQKLGERVITARRKLDDDRTMQTERAASLRNASSSTMKFVLDRMEASFNTFSPFLERTLLIAWTADSEKCQIFMLKACKKVLSAPINKTEYEWFNQYVLPSSVWMFETKPGRHMYQELMEIVQRQSADIVNNMDSVYAHLEKHSKWSELMAIKNQSAVDRQDHKRVGLLKESGIQSVADEKDEEIRGFVDSHVAIQALTVTAKAVDKEFQQYMGVVMGSHGVFAAGPTKKVERCLGKLENDYNNEAYPKSAKLLDLVRCSVTFNTLEQLLVGYRELMSHMDRSSSNIKMARVKNGFLDKAYDGGYRDIKVNVIFQSPINPKLKMICEVQLILSQYLNEKKKIHKLYSIAREETYFEMTVKPADSGGAQKDLKDLTFNPVLNVGDEVSLNYSDKYVYKCTVESDLQLLSMEAKNYFGVIDIKTKKTIWEMKKDEFGQQASRWLTIDGRKYLAVQSKGKEISVYRVVPSNGSYAFEEDKKYKIKSGGWITYCDFDRDFKKLVLVVNQNTLELRYMSAVNDIKMTISLKEKVRFMTNRCMQLSANGRMVVISGGNDTPYFYVVDVESGKQTKFQSTYLEDTYAPSFINGETKYVFVSDYNGRMEIWDIAQQKPIKTLETDTEKGVYSSASTHNVLAVGSNDKSLRLYDVRNWNCIFKKQLAVDGDSLYLTEDLQYITFSGVGSDQCVVLKVE